MSPPLSKHYVPRWPWPLTILIDNGAVTRETDNIFFLPKVNLLQPCLLDLNVPERDGETDWPTDSSIPYRGPVEGRPHNNEEN